MTFITHTLFTTAGVQILRLTGQETFLAYTFGVLVDFDHLFKLPQYFQKNRFSIERHYNWRTFFQEPVSLLWIIPLSIFLKTWVPLVFFLGHLFLDYLSSYSKHPLAPVSNYVTRGFLSQFPDIYKEIVISSLLIVLNIILFLKINNII